MSPELRNPKASKPPKPFAIDGGSVRLAPAPLTLESAFGSVKPAASSTGFDAVIRSAKDDKALRTTGV